MRAMGVNNSKVSPSGPTWGLVAAFFLFGPMAWAQTPGVPWTGEPGKTETVSEIMARQARRPPVGSIAPQARTPEWEADRPHLSPTPNAWPVARFPVVESSTQLSPQAPQTVGVN